ncbi:MAG: BspA family leucine-rich repeat surface protein, partial [Lachnospiraceae bacterium]|nr:BspA family leucine-rich repeat surface protein [Lachnospiraceae bacterium]
MRRRKEILRRIIAMLLLSLSFLAFGLPVYAGEAEQENENAAEAIGDPEGWPEPAANWYEDYEYTLEGEEPNLFLRLNKSKGTISNPLVVIPATAVIDNKTYKVVISSLDSNRSAKRSLWYPDVNTVTGIKIESGVTITENACEALFAYMGNVTTIDLSGLDTTGATRMRGMFTNCSRLESITLGDKFDTSKVTTIEELYAYCKQLTDLQLQKFDTSALTDMHSAFCGTAITSFTAPAGFDTSGVTDMNHLFYSCEALTSIDVSNFNTSSVRDMNYMFSVRNLKNLTLGSNFNTSSATDLSDMFVGCEELEYLDISMMDTSSAEYMDGMFRDCPKLKTIVFGENFKTDKAKNIAQMFSGMRAIESLDIVSSFNTENVTDMSSMFAVCEKLGSLDVSNFNTSRVTSMSLMFFSCESLTNLDLKSFNTEKVTNFGGMFRECTKLSSLDISSFRTPMAGALTAMFQDCESLTSLDLSAFDTSSAYAMSAMFWNCKKLSSLKVNSFNTSKNTDFSNMFCGCERLTSLDLRSFDFGKWANQGPLFAGSAIRHLYLPVSAMSSYDLATRGQNSIFYEDWVCPLEKLFYAGTQEQWQALGNTVPEGVTIEYEYTGEPLPAPEPKDPEEPEPAGAWYEDYEYTLTDTEIHLHSVKQGFSETSVRIPARATIDGKEYAVVLDRKKPQDGYQNWDGLWVYYETTAQGGTHFSPVRSISFEQGVKVAPETDSLFEDMCYLETVDLTGLDTSAVITMERWFYCCADLTNITFGSSFDSSRSTRFNLMFGNCVELTGIDLSELNTGKGEYLDAMFDQCKKLESIDLSGFDTSSMKYMSAMFAGCVSLKTIDLSSFRTEKLETATGLFSGCTALTEIKWGDFSTQRLEQMGGMFQGCEKLRRLDLRSFDFTAANNFTLPEFAFYGLLADSGVIDLYLPVKAMKKYDFTMKPVANGDGYNQYGNIAPNLKNVYYAGTKEEWEALHNTLPPAVTVEYEYSGEMKPVTDPVEPTPTPTPTITPIPGGGGATDPQPELREEVTSLTLLKGQKFYVSQKDWKLESSNPAKVLAVTKTTVTANKAGTATLSRPGQSIAVTVLAPALTKEEKTVKLVVGDEKQLSINGAAASEGSIRFTDTAEALPVSFSSAAPDVAEVDADGNVRAIAKGNAVISAWVNGVLYKVTVKVTDADTAKRDFTKEVNLVPMQSVNVTINGFTPRKAEWSSETEKETAPKGYVFEDAVVRITTAGKITAIGAGTTHLAAAGGSAEPVSITVTVSEPAEKTVHLNKNSSKTLAMYQTKGTLEWKPDPSDTSGIVTINKNTIKGLAVGETTLSAAYEGFTYKVKVYVEDPSIVGSDKPYTQTLTMKVGQTESISLTKTWQTVLFTSNRSQIAYVGPDGVIHARTKGTAKLTA